MIGNDELELVCGFQIDVDVASREVCINEFWPPETDDETDAWLGAFAAVSANVRAAELFDDEAEAEDMVWLLSERWIKPEIPFVRADNIKQTDLSLYIDVVQTRAPDQLLIARVWLDAIEDFPGAWDAFILLREFLIQCQPDPVAQAIRTAYGHLATVARTNLSPITKQNAHYRIPVQILSALEDAELVPRLIDPSTGIPSVKLGEADEKGVA